MLSRVETAVIYIHPLPYPPRFFHVLPGMPKQQCAFFFWYRVKGEKKKTLTKTYELCQRWKQEQCTQTGRPKKWERNKITGRETNNISTATDRGLSLQLTFHRNEVSHH